MYIELHVIQNFAPSCLNRDDANAPKDCVFGGCRRARISSQCIKRAVRWHPQFAEKVGGQISNRTKLLAVRLARKIADCWHVEPEFIQPVVTRIVTTALVPEDQKRPNQTNVLLFLGESEVDQLYGLISARRDQVENAAAALAGTGATEDTGTEGEGKRRKGRRSKAHGEDDALAGLAIEIANAFRPGGVTADVALFGRMIADKPVWNVEAACQVAHAISTHRVSMEMDFYTAVDDLKQEYDPNSDPGAAMMGTIEFNSACFYRYSLVDFDQLLGNIAGTDEKGQPESPSNEDYALARGAVEGFARASVFAIPTGRQNSMAAQNLPSFVLAVVRQSGAPCSLANAFETPVRVSDYETTGLVRKSIEALDAYWGQLGSMYGITSDTTCMACWLGDAQTANLGAARVGSLEELFSGIMAALPQAGGE